MSVFLSLPPKQIGTTAKDKGYQTLANKFLIPLIKNLPEKSSMIGDKNWNPSDKFWTIKVSAKNLKYITKDKTSPFTLINGKMGKGEVTYTVPDKKPIGIKFTTSNQSKTNTADQERGSAFIFGQSLNNNKKFKSWDDIVADKDTFPKLVKLFKGDVPFDWLISYYAQQKVLLDEVQPVRVSKFNRDGGFMDFFTKLISRKFKITKKDNWDPADIWIIHGDERQYINQIEQSMEGPHQTIGELNDILRGMFRRKEVMGVSLKKTGKVAYYEEVNLSGMIPDTKNYNYAVPMTDLIAMFNIEYPDASFTQDVKIKVDAVDDNKTFTFQIKANSSDARNGSNLKFEPTMKGASSARLGKAPVDDVCDILKEIKSTAVFKNRYQDYPGTVEEFKTHAKGEKYFESKVLPTLLVGKSKITTDISDINKAIENIKTSYLGKKDRGTNTRCKLMGLDFFYQISKLTDKQRNEFVTDMVYLAQKKSFAKRPDFGPFGKIF